MPAPATTKISAMAIPASLAGSEKIEGSVPNVDPIGPTVDVFLYSGFRNLLFNPDGRLNQRGPASNADDTYGLDRWNAYTQSNPVAVSTISDVENGTPFMGRTTQSNAVAQRMGGGQIIEGKWCKHLRGKSATLSGRARSSAAITLQYAILGWTSTEDVVTSDFVSDWTSSNYSAGFFFVGANVAVLGVGSVTLLANTLTDLTPLAAALGSTFNNLAVMWWTQGTVAQNVTVDVALQLEAGTIATPREIRPYGTEISLCQRFYQKSFGLGQAPAQNLGLATGEYYFPSTVVGATAAISPTFSFLTAMRAAPTMTLYNPSAANAQVRNVTDSADLSASSASANGGTSGFNVSTTGNAGAAVGESFAFHWTAESEL